VCLRSVRKPLFLVGVASLLLGVAPLRCNTPGELYALGPGTTFFQGCVGLCLCPGLITDDVAGSFRLVERPTDPTEPFRFFEVRNVRWDVGLGERSLVITGDGHYVNHTPVSEEHQLVLDLQIDGGSVQRFDSGLVPGGSEFPEIAISISTGAPCFDTVIDLRALPVSAEG
jgi:hypothetical protein